MSTIWAGSPANYAVVYLESAQRGANPPIYDAIRQTVPLQTITIHGIDYATIYQLPRPFEQAVGARWGEALHLLGVTIAQAPNRLVVTPAWDVRATPSADYQVFLHLLDMQGQRVAQVDVAPGGADFPPTSAWQPGRQIAVPLPLDLPPNLAPGTYRLTLGIYDVISGTRPPLAEGQAADPALDGPEVLLLGTISLPCCTGHGHTKGGLLARSLLCPNSAPATALSLWGGHRQSCWVGACDGSAQVIEHLYDDCVLARLIQCRAPVSTGHRRQNARALLECCRCAQGCSR